MGTFRECWEKNHISHELYVPYNPKSNGLAKSAVKSVKFLLAKCAETDHDPHRALYEWRNIPRTNGYSPAQLLFRRQQYTNVPSLPIHHQFYDVEKAGEARDARQKTENVYHDLHKSFLPHLALDRAVLVQNQNPVCGTKQP